MRSAESNDMMTKRMKRSDYTKPDHWSRRAKKEGYAARSVYKLAEIDREEGLLRPGMRVLDLGAAPGSWMQYASERVGPAGLVVGVDLLPLKRSCRPNEYFLQSDVNQLSADALRSLAPEFDLLLSDMMPNTMGQKETDHYRSIALAERALWLCDSLLRPGGNFLVKVFQGADLNTFRAQLAARFEKVRLKKPETSRKTSREIYVVGLKKKVPCIDEPEER